MKDSFEKTDKVALEGKAVLTDADLELIAGGKSSAIPDTGGFGSRYDDLYPEKM